MFPVGQDGGQRNVEDSERRGRAVAGRAGDHYVRPALTDRSTVGRHRFEAPVDRGGFGKSTVVVEGRRTAIADMPVAWTTLGGEDAAGVIGARHGFVVEAAGLDLTRRLADAGSGFDGVRTRVAALVRALNELENGSGISSKELLNRLIADAHSCLHVAFAYRERRPAGTCHRGGSANDGGWVVVRPAHRGAPIGKWRAVTAWIPSGRARSWTWSECARRACLPGAAADFCAMPDTGPTAAGQP